MFDPPKGPWEIVPFARCSKADRYIDILDRTDVEWFLRQYKFDYRIMLHLRELLAPTDPVHRLNDDQVIEIVTWRLATRELVLRQRVWRRSTEPAGSGGGAGEAKAGAQAQAAGATSAASPPVRKSTKTVQKDWIGVLVVDERGRPVKDVKVKLKLTDGSEVVIDFLSAELQPDGSYRTDRVLDPGQCEISFPELCDAEWRPK